MKAFALFLLSLSTSAFAASDQLPPGVEKTPNPGKYCPNEMIYPVVIEQLHAFAKEDLVAGSIRITPQVPENLQKELGGVPIIAVYQRQDGREWAVQFDLDYASCTVSLKNETVLTRFE